MRAPPPKAPTARGGERGYTLAVLIMMATVMSILVGAALPAWSKLIQRDKEEELIARGWQYAEAVRVFQNRFGRLPTTLDELIKVRPRCIRHLYKDPMTDEAFAPVFANMPLTPQPGQNQQKDSAPPAGDGKDKSGSKRSGRSSGGDDSSTGFDPGKPTVSPLGPVIGVHSTSNKTASLLFYGRDHYDQWQFTVFMLTHRTIAPGGGAAAGGGRLEASVRWLGRPPFNLIPGGGGLQKPQPPGPPPPKTKGKP